MKKRYKAAIARDNAFKQDIVRWLSTQEGEELSFSKIALGALKRGDNPALVRTARLVRELLTDGVLTRHSTGKVHLYFYTVNGPGPVPVHNQVVPTYQTSYVTKGKRNRKQRWIDLVNFLSQREGQVLYVIDIVRGMGLGSGHTARVKRDLEDMEKRNVISSHEASGNRSKRFNPRVYAVHLKDLNGLQVRSRYYRPGSRAKLYAKRRAKRAGQVQPVHPHQVVQQAEEEPKPAKNERVMRLVVVELVLDFAKEKDLERPTSDFLKWIVSKG